MNLEGWWLDSEDVDGVESEMAIIAGSEMSVIVERETRLCVAEQESDGDREGGNSSQ